MSSTNRGGSVRDPDDFFATPSWCTRALLPKLGRLDNHRILEPSAGRGDIARVLLNSGAWSTQMTLVERDVGRAALLEREGSGLTIICDDFLRVSPEEIDAVDLVVMNPPFAHAQAHIEHALRMLVKGGRCAVLLRLAFCTGSKRAPFREAHPFDLYPLASRPSFTAEALKWMTEVDLQAIAKPDETLDQVRKRMKGSDSADYAWLVFTDGGPGGRFEVLNTARNS